MVPYLNKHNQFTDEYTLLFTQLLTYPYYTEKPEIVKKLHTNKESSECGHDATGQSRSGKYLIGHLNMSFIPKISSYIDTKNGFWIWEVKTTKRYTFENSSCQKQSIKEVSKEFLNDIYRYYY